MPSIPCARLALGLLLLSTPASSQAALDDAHIVGLDTTSFDAFGLSISLWGDRALIGAPVEGGAFLNPGPGAAYVFERQAGGPWSQVAKLKVSGAPYDYFGGAVSLSGDRALIGVSESEPFGWMAGAAYLFERQASGAWLEVAHLTASDAAAFDQFGSSVGLTGDLALCGAQGDDDTGSVFVFERQVGGSWMEVGKLHASDAEVDDAFGYSVSLSGDRVLIGTPHDDGAHGSMNSGSAYVFERQAGGSWLEVAKLTPGDPRAWKSFGSDVSLAGDVALVGAEGAGLGAFNAGSAYVFERQAGGSWAEVAKLAADHATIGDSFGNAVSLRGERALVGAWGADGHDGAAYLFERQADGSWPEVVKLLGQDVAPGAGLGRAVAMSEDQAFVQAPLTSGQGSVLVYDLGALYHGVPAVSLANGGSQDLLLRAGSEHAGELFVLLGSFSGTSPGFTLPVSGLVLPLNPDAYFLWLLSKAGGGIVSPFAGVLDAAGHADARFALPPGAPPSLAGVTLHHAYVALDVPSAGAAKLASNAVRVELVP